MVLTTINHLNNYVFELCVEDESGRQTTFRPTGFHKFYSAIDLDRQLRAAHRHLNRCCLMRRASNIALGGPALAWQAGPTLQPNFIRKGERLSGLGGTVRLISRTRVPGIHRVYNLTVEGEHVYHVTKLVVDGHNNGCKNGPDGKRQRQKGQRMTSDDDALQQLEEIEEAQRKARKGKGKVVIDSIEKSKQRAKNQLKDIANSLELLDDLD